MSAIPWKAVRVVLASTELTAGQKLLWLTLRDLDKGPGTDRAYISAVNLARRVGMGADNVEKARRELKRAGLVDSAPRPGRRDTTWWPIALAACTPRSERPTDDEVMKLVTVLDDLIRVAREGGKAYQSTPPDEDLGRTTIRLSGQVERRTVVRSRGVLQSASREEGGVGGEGASPLSEGWNNPPPSPPPPSEGGTFAREREESGPEVGPPSKASPGNWRDILEKPLARQAPVPIRTVAPRSIP